MSDPNPSTNTSSAEGEATDPVADVADHFDDHGRECSCCWTNPSPDCSFHHREYAQYHERHQSSSGDATHEADQVDRDIRTSAQIDADIIVQTVLSYSPETVREVVRRLTTEVTKPTFGK